MTGQLTLLGGSEVNCSDGPAGTLGRIILVPAELLVTYLAVEPHGLLGAGRLVPIELVREGGDAVHIGCSLAEFEALEADETSQPPPADVLPDGGLPFSYLTLHQIPDGQVEVNGDENIHATDGRVGHLRGLEIDAGDHRLLQLLLQVGHFSAKRAVTVPASAIGTIDAEGITLSLSKSEIADLH